MSQGIPISHRFEATFAVMFLLAPAFPLGGHFKKADMITSILSISVMLRTVRRTGVGLAEAD